MYRFGYFDARWMMGARSLDGKVVILINDVNVPPYVVPSTFTGREGQPYTKPQQMQMVVARFEEAQPYAEAYAKHRFGDVCKSMTPSTDTWQPVIHEKEQDLQPAKVSDGSEAYNCDSADGPRTAYIVSRNSLFRGQNYAFWTAAPSSILCALDRCTQAREQSRRGARPRRRLGFRCSTCCPPFV